MSSVRRRGFRLPRKNGTAAALRERRRNLQISPQLARPHSETITPCAVSEWRSPLNLPTASGRILTFRFRRRQKINTAVSASSGGVSRNRFRSAAGDILTFTAMALRFQHRLAFSDVAHLTAIATAFEFHGAPRCCQLCAAHVLSKPFDFGGKGRRTQSLVDRATAVPYCPRFALVANRTASSAARNSACALLTHSRCS
jgi:hypothetical protein